MSRVRMSDGNLYFITSWIAEQEYVGWFKYKTQVYIYCKGHSDSLNYKFKVEDILRYE